MSEEVQGEDSPTLSQLTEVYIKIRDKLIKAKVVKFPFYKG